MLTRRITFLLVFQFATAALAQQHSAGESLWFTTPANHWLEALPLGNGSLGAMVFGLPNEERVQFNESSLITGTGTAVGFYQPFGNLYLKSKLGSASNYRRELNFSSAIHKLEFDADGISYTREVFISNPDKTLVMMLTSSKSGGITTEVKLKDARTSNPTTVENGSLYFTGRLPNQLKYAATLRLKAIGGKLTSSDSSLLVNKADTLLIFLSAATNLKMSSTDDYFGRDPEPLINENIRNAYGKNYAQLKSRHMADFGRLYKRVHLTLGEVPNLPSNQRLQAYSKGGKDPALAALLFQYGRYLLISSSRIGGLPANLQGIWNNEFKPAWYSQYTTNINLQMNYWPAEVTNLSECHFPMFDWVENLAKRNRVSEDSVLKVPSGWVAYSTNNILGGSSMWRLHRPGNAWLSKHFWEHYQYTGDRDFLLKRAYPLLKEVTQYWEGHLVEGPGGKLITPDGWSPEHGPGKDEGDKKPYPGTSYDQQIVYDLFNNYVQASTVLNIDRAYRDKVIAMRDRLLGPQIGRWGQLQEWMNDVDDSTDHHRHSSHLFAVYPGSQISPLLSSSMSNAASIALDARGNISTGWSAAWRMNIRARLFQPEKAHDLVRLLLRPASVELKYHEGSGVYPNFFDAHPPFQIDGNFGFTAGVAEMLLQSHLGVLHLLPALPADWASGSISGLKARGNVEVGITWKNGTLLQCTLRPTVSGIYVVRYKNRDVKLNMKANRIYRLNQLLKL